MRQKVFALIDATLAALKAAGTLKLEQVPGYVVEPPKNAAHGDWAVNVAMLLTKPEGKPPRDIANAIVFLCSEEASFITGHALVVDGGLTIQLQENLGVAQGRYAQEHPGLEFPY